MFATEPIGGAFNLTERHSQNVIARTSSPASIEQTLSTSCRMARRGGLILLRKSTSLLEVVTMAYASSTCGISRQPANFSKLSFETVVLKGLAADGGLFLPEEVPIVTDWVCTPSVQHSAQMLCSQDISCGLQSCLFESKTNARH
jgi:hypothetical protein